MANRTVLDKSFLEFDYKDCHHILVQVFDSFLKNHQSMLMECQSALERSDFEMLSKKAHQLRGSFKTLGGTQAATIAKELEYLSNSERETGRGQKLLEILDAEVSDLIAELKIYLRDIDAGDNK